MSTAGLQTIAACLALEALLLLVIYQFAGSLVGSIVFSVLIFGPASLFVAPALYRYLVRAGSAGE